MEPALPTWDRDRHVEQGWGGPQPGLLTLVTAQPMGVMIRVWQGEQVHTAAHSAHGAHSAQVSMLGTNCTGLVGYHWAVCARVVLR